MIVIGARQLRSERNRYVKWYNQKRMHSGLSYLSPEEFRQAGHILDVYFHLLPTKGAFAILRMHKDTSRWKPYANISAK